LSAFIVEDMLEFVHAHATYRFVIFDEEDERPRILVCVVFHKDYIIANWACHNRSGCSNQPSDWLIQ
jgi:hypothetical protein